MTDTASIVLSLSMFAIVAIVVFETAKREVAKAKAICICGHRKYFLMSPKGHVQPGDYDCNVYIEGAKYDAWQCRECRCRKFIARS